MKIVYYGSIYPYLTHGIEMWGSSGITNMTRVLRLQKRCVRIMFRLQSRDSCREYFKNNDLLTVISLYVYKTIMFVKNKSINATNSSYYDYNTRGRENVHRNIVTKKSTENDPYVKGGILYNLLPVNIKKETGHAFRTLLKQYLISKCLYRIDEFHTG